MQVRKVRVNTLYSKCIHIVNIEAFLSCHFVALWYPYEYVCIIAHSRWKKKSKKGSRDSRFSVTPACIQHQDVRLCLGAHLKPTFKKLVPSCVLFLSNTLCVYSASHLFSLLMITVLWGNTTTTKAVFSWRVAIFKKSTLECLITAITVFKLSVDMFSFKGNLVRSYMHRYRCLFFLIDIVLGTDKTKMFYSTINSQLQKTPWNFKGRKTPD